MAGIITNENVVLTESSPGRGQHIETYASRLAVVMSLMNSGSLGDGVWGSAEHKAALNTVEMHLQNVRESIAEQEKADAESPNIRS